MNTNVVRNIVGTVAVAVLSGLAWYGWLGRDTEYQIDPVTGVESGPYEAWQVVGCGVTLVVLLVGAILLRVHPVLAAAALTAAFTVAWTAQAAATDESGLFLVGAILVFGGLAVASAVVASLTVMGLRARRG